MSLNDMTDKELISLRRSLPSNSSKYLKVCAELLKRYEEQPDNEEFLKDFF